MTIPPRLLASLAYPEDVAAARLEAFFYRPDYDTVEPVHQLGCALRAESEARAVAAVDAIFDLVDWQLVASQGEYPLVPELWAVMHVTWRGRRHLASVSYRQFARLLQCLSSPAADVAKALFRWLEHGDQEAYTHVARRLVKPPHEVAFGTTEAPELVLRRIWCLVASRIGEDHAEQLLWLMTVAVGGYYLIPAAVRYLAESVGVAVESSGANCRTGGRSDLHAYEVKPALELAWRLDRDLFFKGLSDVVKNPWIKRSQVFYMLDFIDWEYDREVWTDKELCRGVVKDELVVLFQGKHGAKGRVSVKVHDSSARARDALDKKLTAVAAKLQSHVKPTAAHTDDPDRELVRAAEVGQRDRIVELLAAGADPNQLSECGDSVLLLACQADPESARILIEAGADPNQPSGAREQTPLLALLCSNPQDRPYLLTTARYLIELGADQQRYEGWSAIHWAAFHGLVEILELLLEKGVDPNARCADDAKRMPGATALDIAAASQHHAAAKVLRDAGV